MKTNRLVRLSLIGCVIAAMTLPLALAQTTQPAAAPEQSPAGQPAAEQPAAAKQEPAAPAEIEPKAAELIDQVKAAYNKLNALEVGGKVSGNFDVAGQKKQEQQEFTGSFVAPNQFRHESKDGVLLGSTGQKLYVYLPAENVYSSIDASKERFARVPQPIGNMLFGENPSLLMAISQEPTQMLEGATTVKRGDDVTIDAKPYPAIHATRPTDDITLVIDPNTHLLRRATLDLRKGITARGAPDAKLAEFVVDYTTSTPDGTPKPEQFAWAPPQGARDAAASVRQPGGGGFDAKTDLVGKPAPDFTLKDLADQEVKLADAKGNVVLIDFWATWCPPCVEGMPNLERIHKERGKEIKVFAVNSMEEKDKVAGFVKPRNLTVPVLLDADGKVGEAYQVEGWPTSVVVKRDGTIHKVLHPVGPDGEKALEEALNEALKAK